MALHKLTFVLGGAASGKSTIAEQIVNASGKAKVYLATAQAFDIEMKEKIEKHQESRGDGWTTVEEPFEISQVVASQNGDVVLLIDCLTLWLTNILLAEQDSDARFDEFLAVLSDLPCQTVVVSNEVGHGIVPDNALSRKFRAAQGQLNQRVATKADDVVAVMAGLPMVLKGELPL